jgi:ABC-2 type transport system permease protein
MKALLAMMRKEFIHIRRDPPLIGFVLAFPVLLLVLFGYALRLKVDNLVVAVWDQDHTFFSVTVKDRLQADGSLRMVEVDSEDAIRDRLRQGTAHLGLIIPKGFTERLSDNQQSVFRLFVDGTMPTLAQAGLYGARVLTSEETDEQLTFDDPDHPAPPVRKHPIKIDQVVLFNPDMRDSDFFLPGTVGIVIMLVTLSLCTGLVREKEQQTIEQLLVTPIPRWALIVGKMIPYGVVAAVDFAVALLVARLMFDLPVQGSMFAVALLACLFILALLAWGSLMSTISQTQLQAHFLSVFTIVPSVLMSGFIFPIEAMPRWLRPLASSLPMTYFVDAMRGLTLKGVVITDLRGDFIALVVFTVLFTSASFARFRKRLA